MERASRWTALTGAKRRDKPWLNGLPRLIFVSDVSDGLSETVAFSYLKREVIEVVQGELGKRRRWLWLTNRPPRIAELSKYIQQSWPDNLWIGTSITPPKSTARFKSLLKSVSTSTLNPNDDHLHPQPHNEHRQNR